MPTWCSGTPCAPPREDIPMKPLLYTVEKIQGLWDVLFAGRAVRTFFTEAVARLHADCWNADRHPSRAEINKALASGNPTPEAAK